jgi:hypothetical protein
MSSGQSAAALPGFSDLDFLGYLRRIVHLDAEVPNSAFDLGVAKQ